MLDTELLLNPQSMVPVVNRQRNAIEDDCSRRGDFSILPEYGYSTIGGGPVVEGVHIWKPGKASGSPSFSLVRSKDGILLLHCFTSNGGPFEIDKNYNAFDVYCILKHNGDREAARVDLLNLGYGKQPIPLITSAELSTGKYKTNWLIDGVWVEGQPGMYAGPKKGMKTTTTIDMAVSLASGTPFLNYFQVIKPCPVVFMSGESGLATLQETANRICDAKGLQLADLDNLIWSEWLPSFKNEKHLAALDQMLQATGCKVLIIDPLYFCMPGINVASIFDSGPLLRAIGVICQQYGVSLILVHHTRKQGKQNVTYEPAELDDMAWAGFAEFARQWILLSRREQYDPGSGLHPLWLSIGGSAGHGGLWGLNIDEGPSGTPRYWEVELLSPDDVRSQKRIANLRDRIIDAASNFPDGETKQAICDAGKIRSDAGSRTVFDSLVEEGVLLPCDVVKGGRSYSGYKLGL